MSVTPCAPYHWSAGQCSLETCFAEPPVPSGPPPWSSSQQLRAGGGRVPARLLTAAASWARGPRATPAPSAPCAPAGTRAGTGGGSRALPLAPSSRLPARGPPRSALARGSARRSRLGVGGGSRGRAAGAPCRVRAPAGLRESERGLPRRPRDAGPGRSGPLWAQAGNACTPRLESPRQGHREPGEGGCQSEPWDRGSPQSSSFPKSDS